jgi:AcrR family transcriptional regulator
MNHSRQSEFGTETAKTTTDLSSRRRIERAALELFRDHGVDGATTREIARRASLSEGALYRHFPSKEAIAETLFAGLHDRLAGLVRAAGAAGGDLGQQADRIVDAYCSVADEDWTHFAFHLLNTAHFLPTPPGRDNPVSAAEDLIEAAMTRGEIPRTDASVLAAMALGVVLQPALHKAHGRFSVLLAPLAPRFKQGVRAVLFAAYDRSAG